MSLSFINRRFIPAQDSRNKEELSRPWLDPSSFEETATKKQLFRIMEVWLGESLSDETVFSATHKELKGASTVPIEYWDIVDGAGNAVYQLWLFDCDSGTLFAHGTDAVVATICQGCFNGDDSSLLEDLAVAHEHVKEIFPDSELAGMSDLFGD